MQTLANPWLALPTSAPFVLASDAPLVERFNEPAAPPLKIETSLLPEPYVGPVDAPIVLLTLNPGVSAGDFALHADSTFRERVLACHRQDRVKLLSRPGSVRPGGDVGPSDCAPADQGVRRGDGSSDAGDNGVLSLPLGAPCSRKASRALAGVDVRARPNRTRSRRCDIHPGSCNRVIERGMRHPCRA